MTKMAAMPIYGKNLKKSSPNQKADNLETWYAASGAQVQRKFVQMMTLGWPWPILLQGQIWSLKLLYGKKGKTMDFSGSAVAQW